jgi:hypothetical protein
LTHAKTLTSSQKSTHVSSYTTEAELGDLAKLRLAYREAATHYATACDLVRDDAPEAALRYALRQAGALYDQGNEFGDNGALKDAIALYRDAVLSLNTPPTRPLDWAGTQNNLGTALLREAPESLGASAPAGADAIAALAE